MSEVEQTLDQEQERGITIVAPAEIQPPEDFSHIPDDQDDECAPDKTYAIQLDSPLSPGVIVGVDWAENANQAADEHKKATLESIGLSADFLEDKPDQEFAETVVDVQSAPKRVNVNIKVQRPDKSDKKQKPRRVSQQAAPKPASQASLDKLAKVFNQGERLESPINYVFFDSALTVLDSINSITPQQYDQLVDADSSITRMRKHVRPSAVDVIINPMNCRHKFYGLAAMMRDILPRLGEADAAIGERVFHKVGTYSFASYTAVNYPEVQKYVFNLYVQFSHGDKKNSVNGVPVKPLHMKYTKHGLSKLLRMFDSNVNVGMVMFGEDRIAQTDWVDIEPMIEEVCRKLGRKITVFVPSRVLVSRTNKLGINVANAARAKGLMV